MNLGKLTRAGHISMGSVDSLSFEKKITAELFDFFNQGKVYRTSYDQAFQDRLSQLGKHDKSDANNRRVVNNWTNSSFFGDNGHLIDKKKVVCEPGGSIHNMYKFSGPLERLHLISSGFCLPKSGKGRGRIINLHKPSIIKMFNHKDPLVEDFGYKVDSITGDIIFHEKSVWERFNIVKVKDMYTSKKMLDTKSYLFAHIQLKYNFQLDYISIYSGAPYIFLEEVNPIVAIKKLDEFYMRKGLSVKDSVVRVIKKDNRYEFYTDKYRIPIRLKVEFENKYKKKNNRVKK